jgi:protein-L-isoaspartate(D-aspartate) O-methyltransferase
MPEVRPQDREVASVARGPRSTESDVETFADRRRRMVDEQIVARGVADPAVLDAMRAVPREMFVPASAAELAYEDSPVPIGEGQTISQPYVVALMAEALELTAGDRVLEIGAGSGYAAAVLSRIAAEVYAIERHASLAELATSRLKDLGYDKVHVVHGDGTLDWRGMPPTTPSSSPPAGLRCPRLSGRSSPSVGGW